MDAVREVIRQKYGEAALQARSGRKAGCGCGTSGCGGMDPITSNLYDEAQAAAIPVKAMLASLGCDLAQGFIVCPPLTSRQFREWLDRRPPEELAVLPAAAGNGDAERSSDADLGADAET